MNDEAATSSGGADPAMAPTWKPSAAALGLFLRAPGTGAVVATLVTLVVFSLWAQSFLTYLAATSYMGIAAQFGIIAVPVALLMIAGEFDLSIGSVFGLAGAVVALTLSHGAPSVVAVLCGFLAAGCVGLVNGLVVTRTEIPSFIVPLAALDICRGMVLIITKGFPLEIDQGHWVFHVLNFQWHSINSSVAWFIGLVLVGSVILLRTRYGQWIFATGGNVTAARKSGIPTSRVKLILFVATSLCAGLAGMLEMSNFGSIDPLAGQNYELTVIAAVVIGGTSLRGGTGSVIGAAFGVITFGMIQVGLQLASVPVYYFQALVGIVLLAAMILQLYTSRIAVALRSREIAEFEAREATGEAAA